MRALQLTDWKHAPEFRDVDVPEPGPGEVLVRVGAAGACHSDLHLMNEFEEGMVPFGPPFTLGHENAGWVEALGAGARGVEVGQPVAVYGPVGCGTCDRCLVGMENYCARQAELTTFGPGLGSDGGMAPYLLVSDSRHLVPLGDLDPIEAAPLTDAGLTPYHAVVRSLDLLRPGSTAVAIGIGGLGHLGVQILRALAPSRIVAVDPRESARRLALDAGADHAVAPGPDAADEIREHSRGLGADLVVDFVGNDGTLGLAVGVSRTHSQITVVGLGGGTYPLSFFSVPYEASVTTTYWGTIPELREVVALAESGHIRAEISRHALDDAPGVYERLQRGEIDGRAVIVPEG
ncbi:MAG: NAD(P)-dependent alcohol dehydrogenase [Acidimicrobiia bacterium]|nr:NAD(P)-dependent alcohol dehydrogenase [Acidimicrobiia bacterium]